MKVHWTNTAEKHLDAIYYYIAQNSPEYAKRMVDRITRRSQQIAEYPFSGRSVPEYDFKQIREVTSVRGSGLFSWHIEEFKTILFNSVCSFMMVL